MPGSQTLGDLLLNSDIPNLSVSTNFVSDFLLIDIVKFVIKSKEVYA